MASITRLIEDVRRQYRVLADRQIQAALEAALAMGDETDEPPAPVEVQPVAETHDQALEALEELIQSAVKVPETAAAPTDEGVALHATVAEDAPPAEATAEEHLYEGTVRLHVYPGGSLQRVLRFVDEIGKRPQFRVLRMSGNPQREGTEIDLGLREPLPLLETLWGLGHGAEPEEGREGAVPVIAVRLYAMETANR
jgi:hypothetical protein